MHKRQRIRDRAHDIVSNLNYSVYKNRVHPIADADLPAVKVYLGEEEVVEDFQTKQYMGVVSAELRFDCLVKENDTYSNSLDDMLKEIQALIRSERDSTDVDALKNTASYFAYAGLEDVEAVAGDLDAGGQSIIYRVQYTQEL